MRIRIWNAFASNNSGSYTLVGSFPTAERAAEVVQVLAPLLAAQTRWHEEDGSKRPSPLERLSIDENLAWDGELEAWPQYSADNTPKILAVERQVLLHHEYTVSLPRFLGNYFYARGGSVDAKLDHAHHPLVVVFEVWWWDRRENLEARIAERRAGLVRALDGPAGLLRKWTKEGITPLVRPGKYMSEFIAVTVFEDLVNGVAAVQKAIEAHEGRSQLRIFEALDEECPLAGFRLSPEEP